MISTDRQNARRHARRRANFFKLICLQSKTDLNRSDKLLSALIAWHKGIRWSLHLELQQWIPLVSLHWGGWDLVKDPIYNKALMVHSGSSCHLVDKGTANLLWGLGPATLDGHCWDQHKRINFSCNTKAMVSHRKANEGCAHSPKAFLWLNILKMTTGHLPVLGVGFCLFS